MEEKDNLSVATKFEGKADELTVEYLGGSDRNVVTYEEMREALIEMARFAAQASQEKVKVVKGVRLNGGEVIKALQCLGGRNFCGLGGDNVDRYYYVNPFGIIDYIDGKCAEKAIADGLAEEIRLPDKQQCGLKPFERVLVRDFVWEKWTPSLFGKYDADSEVSPYCTSSGYHSQCVRYEGNEHLLGTNADPE